MPRFTKPLLVTRVERDFEIDDGGNNDASSYNHLRLVLGVETQLKYCTFDASITSKCQRALAVYGRDWMAFSRTSQWLLPLAWEKQEQ